MAGIDATVWDLEPHTAAKHDILVYYLKAWFPILARGFRRLLYIDGFAGPGQYSKGEPGSPVLALNVAANHKLLNRPGLELVFLFIEEQADRFANLKRQLTSFPLPSNFRIQPLHPSFQDALQQVLSFLEEQGKEMAPSLVFIDPFGPTGFPMQLVERISLQRRAEVLINFSYQPLNQWFLIDSTKHKRLDELFGDDRWRPALGIVEPRDKEKFLVARYREALGERGWRGIDFRMVNKHNQTQYYLLFGTKHPLGMLAMKRAMRSVAPGGIFEYSDVSNPAQPRLFSTNLDEEFASELADIVFKQRRGTTTSKEDISANELAWHPRCIELHLTQALRILEYESNPPKITNVEKRDGTTRKARTYPKGCLITFSR